MTFPNRHPSLAFCLGMIFSKNRSPPFGIMLHGGSKSGAAQRFRQGRKLAGRRFSPSFHRPVTGGTVAELAGALDDAGAPLRGTESATFPWIVTGSESVTIPGLQRITSCCAAPGKRPHCRQ